MIITNENIDKLNDGTIPFEKRFNAESKGPAIPFGAQIEYKPSRYVDAQRLHQFGKKMLAGIFIGYAQYAGGAAGPEIS